MSYFHFDYDKFYNYYTKDTNVKTKNDGSVPTKIWFYRNSNSNEPESDILSNKYININGIDIFISKSKEDNNDKSELFFTIPKEIDNKLWDIHFHFGKDIITPPNKKNRSTVNGTVPIVFFHKTIQNTELKGKERKNCYYHQKMKIDNFGKIICLQATYIFKFNL